MTKTPEELTEDWKAGKLASGLYYVGNDKVKDFAFVKPNEISVYTLDSKIPMLLKDNAEILDHVPTYKEYKAMQAAAQNGKSAIDTNKRLCKKIEELKEQLAEHRENCCCLENEKLRLDKAKLEDENNTLRDLLYECLAHLSLGEIGTSVTPLNILLTHINAALGESED